MSWHGGGRRPVWHPIYYVYDSSCTVYAQLSLGLTWRMELLDYINLRVCCIQRHLVLSRLISPTPRVHASDLGFIFLPTVCCCCRRQPTATCKLSKRWRHAMPVLMYQMQYHKLSDLSSHSFTGLPVCDMISQLFRLYQKCVFYPIKTCMRPVSGAMHRPASETAECLSLSIVSCVPQIG